MTRNLFLVLCVLLCGCPASNLVVDVEVDTDKVIQVISDTMFVGVTLDTSLISNSWEGLDFSNKKLLTLSKGLYPCYLRLGGIAGDALTFNASMKVPSLFKQRALGFETNFTMSAYDWDTLNTFSNETGMSLIFGLNALKRNGTQWDPTNAVEFLQYTQRKGYTLAGIELGNEPDDFLERFDAYVDPDQMGADAMTLHKVLRNMSYYHNTSILGPDTAKPFIYFDEYLDVDGGRAVDIVTFHHYYFSPEVADLVMFTEPYYFDQCIKRIIDAMDMATFHAKGKPVWLGETSTTSGAGSPNISNTYVAGFMWLDKLGASAKFGLKTVLRQDLYGGYNSLIQHTTFDPNPDYWLTLLYKRLVGSQVLNVTTSGDNSVRVYAHCAKHNSVYNYGPGSLVVYAVNLNPDNVSLSMSTFSDKQLDVFWLTPQENDLQSLNVQLNGITLQLMNNALPPLNPVKLSSYITIPNHSMGFFVIPDAQVALCM